MQLDNVNDKKKQKRLFAVQKGLYFQDLFAKMKLLGVYADPSKDILLEITRRDNHESMGIALSRFFRAVKNYSPKYLNEQSIENDGLSPPDNKTLDELERKITALETVTAEIGTCRRELIENDVFCFQRYLHHKMKYMTLKHKDVRREYSRLSKDTNYAQWLDREVACAQNLLDKEIPRMHEINRSIISKEKSKVHEETKKVTENIRKMESEAIDMIEEIDGLTWVLGAVEELNENDKRKKLIVDISKWWISNRTQTLTK
ncbi:hypothetical protein ACOME3_004226 [Neoechinorhynchus agilis]